MRKQFIIDLQARSGKPVLDTKKFAEAQAQKNLKFFFDVNRDTLRKKIDNEKKRIEEAVKQYENRNRSEFKKDLF